MYSTVVLIAGCLIGLMFLTQQSEAIHCYVGEDGAMDETDCSKIKMDKTACITGINKLDNTYVRDCASENDCRLATGLNSCGEDVDGKYCCCDTDYCNTAVHKQLTGLTALVCALLWAARQ